MTSWENIAVEFSLRLSRLSDTHQRRGRAHALPTYSKQLRLYDNGVE